MQKEPKYFYHATRRENLLSISKSGLVLNIDNNATLDGYDVFGKIFLSSNLESARFYQNLIQENFEEDAVILKVNVSGLEIKKDEFGNLNDFYVEKPIETDLIDFFDGLVWRKMSFYPDFYLQHQSEKSSIVQEREKTFSPIFSVGSISVFIKKNVIDITSDGRPVSENYGNMVARFVVSGREIIDAAIPHLKLHIDDVRNALQNIGIESISGRANLVLSAGGLLDEFRFDDSAPTMTFKTHGSEG